MTAPLSDERLAEIRERGEAPHDPVSCGKDCWRLAHEDVPALLAEVERLRKQVTGLEVALDEVLTERDHIEALLDTFAYAIAPAGVIGEHTSSNDPWARALSLLPPLRMLASE